MLVDFDPMTQRNNLKEGEGLFCLMVSKVIIPGHVGHTKAEHHGGKGLGGAELLAS